MTIKRYKLIKISIVIILSIIFSQALVYNNFLLSIGTLILGTIIMISMTKKVDGVISDERDWDVGGKAAFQSIQIYSWIGVVIMFILKSQAGQNHDYDVIATTIAFSVCFLMLLYGAIFRIRSKGKFFDIYVIISLLVLLLFIVLGFLGIFNL